MVHQNPDKGKVINIVELLSRGLVLHEISKPLYVPANEKWEAHHPHPGEVHEQPDVIGIKARKPRLETEILHDQSHERGILIPRKSKWKNSGELAQTAVIDVRLIMMPLHLLFLMPLFPNVQYSYCH